MNFIKKLVNILRDITLVILSVIRAILLLPFLLIKIVIFLYGGIVVFIFRVITKKLGCKSNKIARFIDQLIESLYSVLDK